MVGAVLTLVGALEDICIQADENAAPCPSSPLLYYGLATVGAGAALAVPGFLMFGTNLTRFHYDGAPPISARVGPVPLPHGGFGLGATLSF
jgi:hypothetical protein